MMLSPGQRWVVLQGDCLEILPTFADKSVAHVITDPPYEAEAHTPQRRVKRQDGDGENSRWGGADGRHAHLSPLVCAHLRGAAGVGGERVCSDLSALDGRVLPGGGRDEVA